MSIEPKLDRKERERITRQQDIMLAARHVFAHRGFANATLDEIAERAEFGKGTIYNYFESKEDIFRQIMESLLDEMIGIAKTSVQVGGSAKEIFRDYARSVIEFYKLNEDFLRIAVREMNRLQMPDNPIQLNRIIQRFHTIAQTLASALEKEQKKKLIINESATELAQVFFSTIHHRTMRHFFAGKGISDIDAEQESSFITRMFFDGILPR